MIIVRYDSVDCDEIATDFPMSSYEVQVRFDPSTEDLAYFNALVADGCSRVL